MSKEIINKINTKIKTKYSFFELKIEEFTEENEYFITLKSTNKNFKADKDFYDFLMNIEKEILWNNGITNIIICYNDNEEIKEDVIAKEYFCSFNQIEFDYNYLNFLHSNIKIEKIEFEEIKIQSIKFEKTENKFPDENIDKSISEYDFKKAA